MMLKSPPSASRAASTGASSGLGGQGIEPAM